MTDFMASTREWEKLQLAKLAVMASRWRQDPVGSIEQIPKDFSAAGRNIAAETVGFAGDVQPIAEAFSPALRGRNRLPTSEELVAKWGDKEHWSHIPAMFVAPGPAEVKAGLLTAKAGLKAMLGLGKELSVGTALAQSIFHGTPYSRFEKIPKGAKTENILDIFSPDKAFSGEGAQAYGYTPVGYFAENPDIAKTYQITLARPPAMSKETMSALKRNDFLGFSSVKEAMSHIRKYPDWAKRWDVDPKDVPAISAHLNQPTGSHLLEVDIDDKAIANMLDWDKPLSEQPEAWDSLKGLVLKMEADGVIPPESMLSTRIFNGTYTDFRGGGASRKLTGRDVYQRIAQELSPDDIPATGQQAASKALNEAGIPGIKYYDGGSRAAGNGTRNIVPFNPHDIKSVKRDGELIFEKATDTAPEKSKLEKAMELVDKY